MSMESAEARAAGRVFGLLEAATLCQAEAGRLRIEARGQGVAAEAVVEYPCEVLDEFERVLRARAAKVSP